MFYTSTNTTTSDRQMPYHKHHCASCQYLGAEAPRTADEKTGSGYVDLYVHTGWRAGLGTFTRRWGPAFNQYAEVPINTAEGARWDAVRLTAIKKGMLKP